MSQRNLQDPAMSTASRSRRPRTDPQVQRARVKEQLAVFLREPRSIEEIRTFLERHFARPVSRRTAERHRDWMIDAFGALPARTPAGRKGWAITARRDPAAQVAPQQLARCRRAAEWLEREGRPGWAQALRDLAVIAAPASAGAEASADTEVSVFGAGVRVHVAAWVEAALQRALRQQRAVAVRYRMSKPADDRGRRPRLLETVLHPYGLVYGERPFLVAGYDSGGRLARDPRGKPRVGWYALDRFERVADAGQPAFGRTGFDLRAYVQQWFGQPRGDEPPFDVAWRFAPAVAARAALYAFHPTQRVQREADGSLIVRFRAAGSLEMHRHLATWGSDVTVVEPPQAQFRAMVARAQEKWRVYLA
jgi:predicted DNA-binding transcriptional regulator YafY